MGVSFSNSSRIMRVLIVLALVAAATAWTERVKGTYEVADFAAHKAKYGKSYSAKEDIMRNAEYLKTVAKINNHNAEYDQGKHTWWMAENAHMDWTAEELEARLGLETRNMPVTAKYTKIGNAADSKDWRDEGAVNAVKGQGSHGIDSQTSYPYTARDGSCDSSKTGDDKDVCSTVSGYTELPAGDEDSLMDAVANIGPISIAANASPWSSHGGGIFDPSSCDPNGLNHGIAMVGYNKGGGYWIIRNSWGSSWGEQGYMRIVMGKNACGITNMSCYPSL